MATIEKALQGVKSRIAEAARAAGRDPRDILLVAVSKTFPAAAVQAALAAGQRDFGENYLQEALEKMAALAALEPAAASAICWHFIGPIQSNKTRAIAERFQWVHSIDRLKIAERLSAQRPATLPPLEVCVQVNTSGELSKSGCAPADAPALAKSIAALPRLRLRGLMTVPEPTPDQALQRARFEGLHALLAQLRGERLALNTLGTLDTLSMGMSADMPEAIAAGSTLVRIGTAIFGART